ncbi:hypothetical protein CASFOL_028963 [Castilleja foliolosa]|uniref:Uncharacterized protein n=1 Tax=Castilleja foliolosa TaxID=1961234 RepID=A0ABD3CCL1_9LAMI
MRALASGAFVVKGSKTLNNDPDQSVNQSSDKEVWDFSILPIPQDDFTLYGGNKENYERCCFLVSYLRI